MRRSLVRPALVVAAAVVCTVIGSAVSAAPAATSPSLPPSLGIPVDDAQGFALDAVASGGVNWWPARTAWSRATPEARVALVNGTLAWSKAFVMSPAFAAVYAERRTATKPEPPESKGSVAAELAAQRAEQRRGMDEMRAALAQMPADQRAAMKEVIAQTEAMLAQQARDPEVQQMMRQGIEAERTERQQRYQESLATWQQDFPADPRRLIALRLQAFLAACSDVAWGAKLALDPASGKRKFVDPELEQRPAEWKLCFRAGRAPVEAARAFAQAWLKELPAP